MHFIFPPRYYFAGVRPLRQVNTRLAVGSESPSRAILTFSRRTRRFKKYLRSEHAFIFNQFSAVTRGNTEILPPSTFFTTTGKLKNLPYLGWKLAR